MKEPVHIIPVGPFGRAVARHLERLRSDTLETDAEDAAARTPEVWPDARIYVIAAWRPALDLCELLDEVSHRRQRPFIPLTVDSATLCLGPIVIPGAGSCWHCWTQRTRQHSAALSHRVALWQHYSLYADAGPRGYLEPFAAMSAARISQTIDALDSHAAIGGKVWQIDMMTRRITTSTVVGVHDCPRCGLRRSAQARSYAEMQQALAYLWPHGDHDKR